MRSFSFLLYVIALIVSAVGPQGGLRPFLQPLFGTMTAQVDQGKGERPIEVGLTPTCIDVSGSDKYPGSPHVLIETL